MPPWPPPDKNIPGSAEHGGGGGLISICRQGVHEGTACMAMVVLPSIAIVFMPINKPVRFLCDCMPNLCLRHDAIRT